MEVTNERRHDSQVFEATDGNLRVAFYSPAWAYDQDKIVQAHRKTRIYVWGEEPVDFSDLPDGWQYSQDPAIKKACRAKNKQEIANMNDLRLQAQPLFEALHHGELATLALKFSRTAGCSCGCSPGFIVDRLVTVTDVNGRKFPIESIHVERNRKKTT